MEDVSSDVTEKHVSYALQIGNLLMETTYPKIIGCRCSSCDTRTLFIGSKSIAKNDNSDSPRGQTRTLSAAGHDFVDRSDATLTHAMSAMVTRAERTTSELPGYHALFRFILVPLYLYRHIKHIKTLVRFPSIRQHEALHNLPEGSKQMEHNCNFVSSILGLTLGATSLLEAPAAISHSTRLRV